MKTRLKIYKKAISILHKFLTLTWNISRTIWRIEVGDGSFFCILHALSCELNFIFDRRFPLLSENHSIDFLPVSENVNYLENGLVPTKFDMICLVSFEIIQISSFWESQLISRNVAACSLLSLSKVTSKYDHVSNVHLR